MIQKPIIIPPKLKKGSHIRVIAPSRSMSIISNDVRNNALSFFEKKGITISFGKHVEEMDNFSSSSIQSRIEDLHDAFSDKSIDAVLTAIGGYNSNQLLENINYELIQNNPKILCGFSDITALANAITTQTGIITYSGPHFSSFGMEKGLSYTIENFVKTLFQREPFQISPSEAWSDDSWFLDQTNREFNTNEGYWILNSGYAYGRLYGGHFRCLSALQGTKYWPPLADTIIFIEEDAETNPQIFDRLLQSLIQQPNFEKVRGVLIGRFQKKTGMTKEKLTEIVKNKKELDNIPVLANMDFGHTTPILTLPTGGVVEVDCRDKQKIKLIEF